jgi:hypothetical protein
LRKREGEGEGERNEMCRVKVRDELGESEREIKGKIVVCKFVRVT